MKFAGHPTLGAAFVLAPLQRGVVELETGAGIVPVALERDESGRIVFGRMTQPLPRVEEVRTRTGPRRDRRAALDAPGRALRQRRSTHRRDARRLRGARHARPRRRGDRGARDHRRQRDRAQQSGWRNRMPGHTERTRPPARRRADRVPPCARRADRMGRRDRDRAGRRDGTPVDAHARADGGDGLIDAVEVGGAAVIVARGEFRL